MVGRFIGLLVALGASAVLDGYTSPPQGIQKTKDGAQEPLQQQDKETRLNKVRFSVHYPTLAAAERITLPTALAAQHAAMINKGRAPQTIVESPPPLVTISDLYHLNVVSDCIGEECSFGSVYVYIHRTNWFVEPGNTTVDSLVEALKAHATQLLKRRSVLKRSHLGLVSQTNRFLVESLPRGLKLALSSACFMQPAAHVLAGGSVDIRWKKISGNKPLSSLFQVKDAGRFLSMDRNGKIGTRESEFLSNSSFNSEQSANILSQHPQNFLAVCRNKRDNSLRLLAEKNYIICSVVLRAGKDVVDSCEDLPVHNIHKMDAVEQIHQKILPLSLPMLGYVPVTLPHDSPEVINAFLRQLIPLEASRMGEDKDRDESCVAKISQELQEIEGLHGLALWRTAEAQHRITAEMLLRSQVKYAHFILREIAPFNKPEYGASLLKLANKWARTSEVLQQFNASAASCQNPTLRPVYIPQYSSTRMELPEQSAAELLSQLKNILSLDITNIHRLLIGGAYVISWALNTLKVEDEERLSAELDKLLSGAHKLLLDFAAAELLPEQYEVVKSLLERVFFTASAVQMLPLSIVNKWCTVSIILAVPFWVFAFGQYVGPAKKSAAIKTGNGLCPYHILAYLVDMHVRNACTEPGLTTEVCEKLRGLMRSLGISQLPRKLGMQADAFLEQQLLSLPARHPGLFRRDRLIILKIFPLSDTRNT